MMPYITEESKNYLEMSTPESPGQLNYKLTMIVKDYIEKMGESYQTYNDIIGALECCIQEVYRRKIVPYEDKKILENGDVY